MTRLMQGAGSEHSVFVHIVTFNNVAESEDLGLGESTVEIASNAVLSQSGFTVGHDLFLHITDNASSDQTVELLKQRLSHKAVVNFNSDNIGFAAAHNQAISNFLKSDCSFYLCLNPDLKLENNALMELVNGFKSQQVSHAPVRSVGMVAPRLLRADSNLNPIEPRVIDAAGIYFSSSLRHLDRASGQLDYGQLQSSEPVFGASGAAVLYSREFVIDLLLETEREQDLAKVYPILIRESDRRAKFFDEGFFAYREDAELAWRAKWRGWGALFQPSAVGYHIRHVLPERRATLNPELNSCSVRNRFLMQLVNYTPTLGLITLLNGAILRNLAVLFGVLLTEQSSIKGLRESLKLFKRALDRRRFVMESARVDPSKLRAWFS